MKWRLNLVDVLLWAAALPIWLYLAVTVPAGTGWAGSGLRWAMAPLVLVAMTVAIERLLQGRTASWSLAALAAGVVTLLTLTAAAWLSS